MSFKGRHVISLIPDIGDFKKRHAMALISHVGNENIILKKSAYDPDKSGHDFHPYLNYDGDFLLSGNDMFYLIMIQGGDAWVYVLHKDDLRNFSEGSLYFPESKVREFIIICLESYIFNFKDFYDENEKDYKIEYIKKVFRILKENIGDTNER